MQMKLFILLIIASIGCSTATNATKQVEELRILKTKYNTLVTEIDTKRQSLDRSELNTKQREVVVLESKMKEVEQQIDDVIIDLTYQKNYKKGNETPAFRIKSMSQQDENLEVNLQYSGGCGDPHQFELISNGDLDAEGIVDFYLIDNTVGDNCKMLVMKTKYFNITKMNKKSEIKGFRLNDSKVTSFSRTK
jgi:hypothetical protein